MEKEGLSSTDISNGIVPLCSVSILRTSKKLQPGKPQLLTRAAVHHDLTELCSTGSVCLGVIGAGTVYFASRSRPSVALSKPQRTHSVTPAHPPRRITAVILTKTMDPTITSS